VKLTALLLISAAAVAQDRAPDPLGWSGATWGMTFAQVQDVIVNARPLRPPTSDFGATGRLRTAAAMWLGPVGAMATFEFARDADRLIAIRLEVDNQQSPSSAYTALRHALIEKYGRPISSDTVESRAPSGSVTVTRSVQWSRPHTTILLNWYDAGPVGAVSVRYSERNPADSL
jgi:hypothetical protein